MLLRFACVIGVMIIAISAGQGRMMREVKVGAWDVGTYLDDKNDTFSSCIVSASYQSGTMLLFLIDKNYQWSMGLANHGWRLATGDTYKVAYVIDSDAPQLLSARAIGGSQISIPLHDSAALFLRFRKGKVLTILAAGAKFQFELTGSADALAAALQCVNRYRQLPASSNPFAGTVATQQQPFDSKAEAVTVLANILSNSAALGSYKFLQPDEAERYFPGADAVWISNGLIGTIRIGTESGIDPEALATALIDRDSKSYTKFATAKTPIKEKHILLDLSGVCVNDNGITQTQYLAVAREKGGLYFYSLFSVSTKTDQETNRLGLDAFTAAVKTEPQSLSRR